MQKALIKIAYRQAIDASAENTFEKNVLILSYNEFILKSQAYNPDGKFKTFTEMKTNDGRANSLHYKSGFAVDHLIAGLDKQIPGLKDNLNKNIEFDTYKFELIESDITDRLKHAVAVTYFTETLTLLDNVGDYLLFAKEIDLKS